MRFEFDKMYSRTREERDYIATDFLFLHTKTNSLLIYDGLFYLINKGSTLNLGTFSELSFAANSNPGETFHITALYNGHKFEDAYMVLEEGIIKFYEDFNTMYGCTTTFCMLATPTHFETTYLQLQEEIKTCEKLEATDWRFL